MFMTAEVLSNHRTQWGILIEFRWVTIIVQN